MAGMLAMLLWPPRLLLTLGVLSAQLFCISWFSWAAYEIRLHPIREYGHVIHEFDPWFNYRATEYLAENGVSKFFKWYDYESWYPIGRPIGTTIFPGMQLAAVGIWEAQKQIPAFQWTVPKNETKPLRRLIKYLEKDLRLPMLPKIPKVIKYAPMSVNDICCMMPPWFGSIASIFTGLLAYEASGRSTNSMVMATAVMSVIPAHLMRSVGGEFDNEAVAMASICCTFWLWCRSVRTPTSWPIGFLAGLSYVYMVAAWGGYIFVLNMIGVHALMLVALGRFNSGVHKAYTLFFVIGTLGAIQVPVVGMQPLRSLEQIGPLLVFLGYQVLAFSDYKRWSLKLSRYDFVILRIKYSVLFLIGLAVVGTLLWPTGYFGPLSSRIRGLFVKHTKTGNPLVDSVAEHQPASAGIYRSYLNLPLDYWQLGGLVCLLKRNNAAYFIGLYACIASHFSGKMSRLVLICGPIAAIGCALWAGFLLDLVMDPFFLLLGKRGYVDVGSLQAAEDNADATPSHKDSDVKTGGKKTGKDAPAKVSKNQKKKDRQTDTLAASMLAEWDEDLRPGGFADIKRSLKSLVYKAVPEDIQGPYRKSRVFLDTNPLPLLLRIGLSVFLVNYCYNSTIPGKVRTFVEHCDSIAQSLANPKVMYKVNDGRGGKRLISDYYDGYKWIDANTPKDARVMAWWDYGYQITGIGRRTSIADGNTWNHEHIATLGRTLTSPEKKAHNAIRHLADYVLVWAGGGGDDLAKSPHLARIGNSVFPEHCGDDDPRCNKFGFYDQQRTPTPMMAKSLLYRLVANGVKSGVTIDPRLWKEVHTSKHGLMRVYKVLNVSEESKAWVANPANRVCDAPGSWYCVGQYPPALDKLIAKRNNFAQVEDFNKGGQKSAYTKLIEAEKAGKKREL